MYLPVITVKHGRKNIYGHEVELLDGVGNVIARILQPRDRKLSCGARVWIESVYPVRVIEEMESDDTVISEMKVTTL